MVFIFQDDIARQGSSKLKNR